MTKEEFVVGMKSILKKAGDAAGIDMTWHSVSEDPDRIADFGLDSEENLCFGDCELPLNVSDLTGFRYRVEEDWGGYIRFVFGKNRYINYYFSDTDDGFKFDLKYDDNKYYVNLSWEKMLEILKA